MAILGSIWQRTAEGAQFAVTAADDKAVEVCSVLLDRCGHKPLVIRATSLSAFSQISDGHPDVCSHGECQGVAPFRSVQTQRWYCKAHAPRNRELELCTGYRFRVSFPCPRCARIVDGLDPFTCGCGISLHLVPAAPEWINVSLSAIRDKGHEVTVLGAKDPGGCNRFLEFLGLPPSTVLLAAGDPPLVQACELPFAAQDLYLDANGVRKKVLSVNWSNRTVTVQIDNGAEDVISLDAMQGSKKLVALTAFELLAMS